MTVRKMRMSDKKIKEIQKKYNNAIKELRKHDTFEAMTFTTHPRSDDARFEVASLFPEVFQELKRERKRFEEFAAKHGGK